MDHHRDELTELMIHVPSNICFYTELPPVSTTLAACRAIGSTKTNVILPLRTPTVKRGIGPRRPARAPGSCSPDVLDRIKATSPPDGSTDPSPAAEAHGHNGEPHRLGHSLRVGLRCALHIELVVTR